MRRPATLAAALCLVLCGVYVAVAARAHPLRPTAVDFPASSAWLGSLLDSHAVLVDGSSAQIVTTVSLGAPSSAVVQAGTDAYFIDARSAAIKAVQGATFTVKDVPGAGSTTTQRDVLVGKSRAYVVDDGTGVVYPLDPATLKPGPSVLPPSTGVSADDSVVDDSDTVWTLDRQTGSVIRIKGANASVERSGPALKSSELVLVGGRAVVATHPGLAARYATGGATTSCPALAGDAKVTLSATASGSILYAASSARGIVVAIDLHTHTCDRARDLGASGDELGRPVQAGSRVFVPDYSKGIVHIVDTGQPGQYGVLDSTKVVPPGVHFDMFARSEYVFFNNPDGPEAGVIRLDGQVHSVEKYLPVGGAGSPTGGQPTQPPTTPTPPTTPPPTTPPPASDAPQDTTDLKIALSDAQPKPGQEVGLAIVHGPGVSVASVDWNLGDGTELSGEHISHQWARPGDYQIYAVMRLGNGDTKVLHVDVVVHGTHGGEGSNRAPEPTETHNPTATPSAPSATPTPSTTPPTQSPAAPPPTLGTEEPAKTLNHPFDANQGQTTDPVSPPPTQPPPPPTTPSPTFCENLFCDPSSNT
ncbi:PKD domain-containing protein [Pseudofrankia inefficax]|nr:PKD domain-containing protein [Pseudofrankia inefficax]